MSKYRQDFEWIITTDMDEYPVVPQDTEPGFLRRAVEKFASSEALLIMCLRLEKDTGASQIIMPNFGFLSFRDRASGAMMIQQVNWQSIIRISFQ